MLPRVVIVGGGFAGLYCARALARAPVAVTLVDRRNHHLFQPLLYQVATASLNTGDIAVPLRGFVRRQGNLDVVLCEVRSIDLPGRRVLLSDGGAIPYDHLVIAAGASHSYLGHPEWARFAPGLKTLEDAVEIRRRVLVAFEDAERAGDPAQATALLTFVVVGGGPTGVELAGALVEIARHTLTSEFRRIDPAKARVILLEAMDRVLPGYPPGLSAAARRQLEALGVEVRTGARVTRVDATGVALGEERLPARTVLWGAGVAASSLGRALGVPLDRAGRVEVLDDLTVPGHPEVYVAGDLARVPRGDGTSVPGLAPAAIQEGRAAARNILRSLDGEPRRPFRYRDRGTLSTIGRGRAVGRVGPFHLQGPVAWLAWLFVHLMSLVGFRNRLVVVLEWAWAYATWGRGARLIVDTAERWQGRLEDGAGPPGPGGSRSAAPSPPRPPPPSPAGPPSPGPPPHASPPHP